MTRPRCRLGSSSVVEARDRPQDRHVGRWRDRLADHRSCRRRGDPVEDHAGEVAARDRAPGSRGRGPRRCAVTLVASTTRTTGAPMSLGELGAWSGSRAASMPSNRPRLPSMTAMSARAAARASEAQDRVRRHQEGVEVAAAAPGRGAEPGGVDVVRPLLEGATRRPTRAQGPHQAGGDERLAGIAGEPGDDDARAGVGPRHRLPPCPTPFPGSRTGTRRRTSCSRRRARA